MTPQDIECELSYAYLHAVAAAAGVSCQNACRTMDNAGIDAVLHTTRDFGEGAPLTEVSIHLQLKATTAVTSRSGGRISYFLKDLQAYDRMRKTTCMPPKVLGVLFLPSNRQDWLTHGPEELVLKKCGFWTSLAGAPASTNDTGQTVKLPESQVLSPGGLLELFGRVARQEPLLYAQ